MAQLDAHPTGDQEVAGSIPTGSATVFFVEIDHEIFSVVILSLPPIQEKSFWQKNVHNTG